MNRSKRQRGVSLFERPAPSGAELLRERAASFAREVARRHRRGGGDGIPGLLAALRAWHRAWAVCRPGFVPELDEETLALAVAAYVNAGRHRTGNAA